MCEVLPSCAVMADSEKQPQQTQPQQQPATTTPTVNTTGKGTTLRWDNTP